LLQLENVTLRFGGNTVLKDIAATVERAEIYGLIGPNGCGKTTFLNVVSGVYHPTSGKVLLKGVETTNLPPYAQELRCMARTFQIPKLWRKLSVLENIMVASFGKNPKRTHSQTLKQAEACLSDFGLADMMNEPASNLSGGQSKLLETARAFACDPEIVLLDEPLAGVAPSLVPRILDRIRKERDSGVTILVVSHVISGLANLCDRLAVMSSGNMIAVGKPREVLAARNVVEAYLGESSVTAS